MGPRGGRSRACCSWCLEGVEVFLSTVRASFGILSHSLATPVISLFVLSVTVIVFPYGSGTIFVICIIV